ncbi:MAG: sigma-70 family RNA polymerase sigma factor [Acidobacteria bacterium]|nr:sigma-70 family RNA polymerase sigma factor [Acidobacteriota bacterium]
MTRPPITKDAFPQGDSDLEQIYPYVYDELRRLAAYYMKQERSNHTLQPTALVHEAYLRLFKQENHEFKSRTHFISVAANMMRRILVNHAVRRNRNKREGMALRITLDRAVDSFEDDNLDLLALDEALHKFGAIDERAARIFELRFFGGLTVEEIGEVLDLSAATVKREWAVAKVFLKRELFGNSK